MDLDAILAFLLGVGAVTHIDPASSPSDQARLSRWIEEGRGRDGLTDEITKKEREGGRPPTQNNVPQRQRHPGAVGQPSTRKVSRDRFIILYFSTT